jgi:hypothetical protein
MGGPEIADILSAMLTMKSTDASLALALVYTVNNHATLSPSRKKPHHKNDRSGLRLLHELSVVDSEIYR